MHLGYWGAGAVLATAVVWGKTKGDVEGASVWKQRLDCVACREPISHFRVRAHDNVSPWWLSHSARASPFAQVPNGWKTCPCEKLKCPPSASLTDANDCVAPCLKDMLCGSFRDRQCEWFSDYICFTCLKPGFMCYSLSTEPHHHSLGILDLIASHTSPVVHPKN